MAPKVCELSLLFTVESLMSMDVISKSTRPQRLPIQLPTNFELVWNFVQQVLILGLNCPTNLKLMRYSPLKISTNNFQVLYHHSLTMRVQTLTTELAVPIKVLKWIRKYFIRCKMSHYHSPTNASCWCCCASFLNFGFGFRNIDLSCISEL